MAVFRVEKTKDFTIMCNHHLLHVAEQMKGHQQQCRQKQAAISI